MASKDPRAGLPEVLRSPMAARRLASELETAAAAVDGDDFLSQDRRTFLASAALQVAGLADPTGASSEHTPAQFRPAIARDDLETRAG